MSLEAVNNISNISFKGNNEKIEEKQTKTPEEIKDGKKKLTLALGGLAIAAAASIGIAMTIKGKKPKNLGIEEFKQNGEFNNGIAKFKNKLFNGTIEVPVIEKGKETGKKRILEYKNGEIKSSTLTEGHFIRQKKTYSKDAGIKTIKTTYMSSGYNSTNLDEIASTTTITPNEIKTIRHDNWWHVDSTRTATKQPDGSWKTILEAPDFAEDSMNGVMIKKDMQTGEILSKTPISKKNIKK